ncbi:MAG: PaaI family thioesterase [Firmicutes bacterium]|nr:PaaI family thioesterase [Bacillota bacterium]
MKELPLYKGCFVCGDENPAGLGVRFFYVDGEGARGEFLPDARWEGYPGVVHGGILAALLDEVMYKAVFAQGELTVTAGIEVRYHHPARVGIPLELKGWVEGRKRRLITARGEIRGAGGRLVAAAKGAFCVLSPAQQENLLGGSGDFEHRS